MLPMDRIEITAFRFLGGIGSCFTMFQSVIWLGLSITGVACKYLACGKFNQKSSFGYCFYLLYFNDESKNAVRINFINSYYFNIMMWVNIVISLINLIISKIMVSAFVQWVNAILIKRIANIWIICIILFSIIEFVMCAIFIYDIIVLVGKDSSKCFKKTEITYFGSIYESNPAPYLSQLKINLQKLKKKIRNLKTSLLFLDIIVDEDNNSYHIENPFIIKTSLNEHVKEVWHDLFNNNITDNMRHKSKFLPYDNMLKTFLLKQQIDLDEVDIYLLKSFDNLTNIKWVQVVENSNVAIGKNYLNSNINLKNQTNFINKMAILLHEYLKNKNEPPTELMKADKILDNVTRQYLLKLEAHMHDLYDMNFKNITEEYAQNAAIISNNEDNNEEILVYLKQFFNGLLSLQDEDKMYGNLFQHLLKNFTELFGRKENLEIDSNQKIKNIKEYLRRQYELDDVNITNKTKSTIAFRQKNITSTKLEKELCENCSSFILWPIIICILLSLKTGLVWILNIILAYLVYYYGDKIDIRRKHKVTSIIKYE